jgi:hypothetical protein
MGSNSVSTSYDHDGQVSYEDVREGYEMIWIRKDNPKGLRNWGGLRWREKEIEYEGKKGKQGIYTIVRKW